MPPSLELPWWLSCFPEKISSFKKTSSFRSCWNTIESLDRRGIFPVERLWQAGAILFKADSVIRGNALVGLRLLEEAGFRPRVGRIVQFSPALVREFWRYSLGRLSDSRIKIMCDLMTCAPSFFVLVEAAERDNRYPAALRLTHYKGEAAPALRRVGQLRHAMGPPHSTIFNYVHTADEPADVVRELGLLFGERQCRRILREFASDDHAESTTASCQGLLDVVPRHDLDFDSALGRMRSAIPTDRHSKRDAEVLALIERIQRNLIPWSTAKRYLILAGVPISRIDDLAIAAQSAAAQRKIKTQIFPSCELRHWATYQFATPTPTRRDQSVGASTGLKDV